jgi:hypothetical protein
LRQYDAAFGKSNIVQRAIAILIATWGVCAGLGLVQMLNYALTPALTAAVAPEWPRATQLVRDSIHPTLILFLHPRCPCSRATLRELQLLAADCGGRFALRIVFVRPPGVSDGWEWTDLYRSAEQIPSAVVSSDTEGTEAAQFSATTSGEALLYAADGSLLFHGGLTPSRGHEGDSAGRCALTSLIWGRAANCTQTAVFGCSLVNHSEPARTSKSDANIHQPHD